jgi:hypothetical protein
MLAGNSLPLSGSVCGIALGSKSSAQIALKSKQTTVQTIAFRDIESSTMKSPSVWLGAGPK